MTDKMMKSLGRNRRSIALDNTGYKKYFGMSAAALANDRYI